MAPGKGNPTRNPDRARQGGSNPPRTHQAGSHQNSASHLLTRQPQQPAENQHASNPSSSNCEEAPAWNRVAAFNPRRPPNHTNAARTPPHPQRPLPPGVTRAPVFGIPRGQSSSTESQAQHINTLDMRRTDLPAMRLNASGGSPHSPAPGEAAARIASSKIDGTVASSK